MQFEPVSENRYKGIAVCVCDGPYYFELFIVIGNHFHKSPANIANSLSKGGSSTVVMVVTVKYKGLAVWFEKIEISIDHINSKI